MLLIRDRRGEGSVGGKGVLGLIGWITPRRWWVGGGEGHPDRCKRLQGGGAWAAGLKAGLTLMIGCAFFTPPLSP